MAKAKAKTKTKEKSRSKPAKRVDTAPKEVAGAKLPKALRSSSLMSMFNSDLGREILADALIAAAGAAAAALTRNRTAKQVGGTVKDAGSKAASTTSEVMQTAAGAVAGVVADAARNLLPASVVNQTEKAEGSGEAEKSGGGRPRYVHLASDHSARKSSRKVGAKADKPGKA
jgi:hypothetical protein